MSLLQAFILGVVQGITEYFPISSTAHLILVSNILGWHFTEQETFLFAILVQLGTLVGVIFYFFYDIKNIFNVFLKKNKSKNCCKIYFYLLVLSTLPAVIFGFSFKHKLIYFFSSPKSTILFLFLTAAMLIICEFIRKKCHNNIKLLDAFLMGLAQALALFPGISRSGVTISVGIICGLKKESAAKFSFLMSIPIILAASFLALKNIFVYSNNISHIILPIFVGFFSAAISGYFAIKWFLNFIKNQSLLWFASYCLVVGVIGLIFI